MTQHQMGAGETDREGSQASYPDYGGVPHYDNYSSPLFGQKLSQGNSSSSFSSRQLFALAIISLILWVVVFFIVGVSAASISADNPSSHILYPLLIAALVIYSFLALVINVLFHLHRRH